MKWLRRGPVTDVVLPLLLASAASLVLYGFMVQRMGQAVFTYLPNNLLLAWLPLLLAIWLSHLLRDHLWSSWPALAVTALWLVFLPNSFYLITDFIHLKAVYPDYLVSSAALFFSFALTGLLLGYTSLYIVHQRLLERRDRWWSWVVVAGTLLICSLAIYIGRDLRWNSWDVLLSPAGLLFDLSMRLLHPSEYGSIVAVAGGFFILLLTMYVVIRGMSRLLAKAPEL